MAACLSCKSTGSLSASIGTDRVSRMRFLVVIYLAKQHDTHSLPSARTLADRGQESKRGVGCPDAYRMTCIYREEEVSATSLEGSRSIKVGRPSITKLALCAKHL